LTDVEREIFEAALRGVAQPKGRAPVVVIMWGGIGAGKTTVSPKLMAKLRVKREKTVVDIDVDNLVQRVPAFQAAKGTDAEQAAYMKYRGDAKKIQKQVALAALEHGFDVYVEWTNEGNLHALSSGQADLFSQAAMEARRYLLAVCLVECRDVEGILEATRERAKQDGRHIPEQVIREFNADRAQHWFTALQKLERGTLPVRAFAETRLRATEPGLGIVELTGGAGALASRSGYDGGFPDEEAAQAAVDQIRKEKQSKGGCCTVQ